MRELGGGRRFELGAWAVGVNGWILECQVFVSMEVCSSYRMWVGGKSN